jgi:hypothetical protein
MTIMITIFISSTSSPSTVTEHLICFYPFNASFTLLKVPRRVLQLHFLSDPHRFSLIACPLGGEEKNHFDPSSMNLFCRSPLTLPSFLPFNVPSMLPFVVAMKIYKQREDLEEKNRTNNGANKSHKSGIKIDMRTTTTT